MVRVNIKDDESFEALLKQEGDKILSLLLL